MNAALAIWFIWSLTFVMIGVAMWGQYWYDRAHRLMDAVEYMTEEENKETEK